MHLIPQLPINATCDAYHGVALSLFRQACQQLPNKLDIAYGTHPEQRLDIFLPPCGPVSDLPIFLNIHGGGWTHGYKEWMGLNAFAVTGFPAVYASLSYRLAPAAKHPAMLDDCLSAVSWLANHASTFGGNPDSIHIGGHSAGAQIAALAALRTDFQSAHGLAPGTIKSCFAYSGLFDLRGAHQAPIVPGISPVPMLEDANQEVDASPIVHVRETSTHFHLSWGAQEPEIFKSNGNAFAEALLAAGNKVQVEVLDLDHFWIHLDQVRPESAWNRSLRSRLLGQQSVGDL